MMRRHATIILAIVAILILTPILAGCGATAVPTAVPTTAPKATSAPTTAPVATTAPTKAAPTAIPATATAKAPPVGGTLVIPFVLEPPTLDVHKTPLLAPYEVLAYVGASLLNREPGGTYVPYLCESYKLIDATTFEFALKKNVKFHDGTPVTAKDYVYTWTRGQDPKTTGQGDPANPATPTAVDDYTLRLSLKKTQGTFINNLSKVTMSPLKQSWVEKWGDNYGRNPMSVGPYVFKQWITGDRIILERNPDFNWGPDYWHKGPAYIQTIEFRMLAEPATILAGMESGEVSRYSLEAKDVARIQATGLFDIKEGLHPGALPVAVFNDGKGPFTDVKVRKAFNMAIDRDKLIKVALLGNGIPMYGPLSPTQIGYWSGVEKIGYTFDLPKAKALMAEAGYVAGADGMLSKDGKPFQISLLTIASWEKPALVLQEQLKLLGVDIKIEMIDAALKWTREMKGDFELTLEGISNADGDILYICYHSAQMGMANVPNIKDPELDKLAEAQRYEMDFTKRMGYLADLQKYFIDQAVEMPLYVPKTFNAQLKSIKGATWSPVTNLWYIQDAYIEK